MEAARTPWPALGVLLIRDGLVTPEQLEEVLDARGDRRENRISSRRLGEALVERGCVTSAQVARLVAEQHELPFIDLDDPDAMVPLAGRLPEELARRLSALPIRLFPDGSLLIVVADPTKPGIYDEIRRAVGAPIRLAVAAPDLIGAAIEEASAGDRFRSGEIVDVTDTLEARDAESSDIGLHLAALPDGAEPPVTTGHDERAWRVLGSLLLRDGLVTELELETALAQQRLSSTRRLGEILVQRGAVTETAVARALAEQHELPFVDLAAHELDLAAAARLPLSAALEHRVLPISYLPGGGPLLVVAADPASAVHSDELRAALGCPFQLAVAAAEEIDAALALFARSEVTLAQVPEPDLEPVSEPEPVSEHESPAEPALELDPPPDWPALPDLGAAVLAAVPADEEPQALEAEADTEWDVALDPDPDLSTQADAAEADVVDAEAEIDVVIEAEVDATDVLEAEADVEDAATADAEVELGADTEDELEVVVAAIPDAETEIQAVAHAELDDEPSAEAEDHTETAFAADAEDAVVAEVDAEDDETPAPMLDTEPEPEPESESTPALMDGIEAALALGATVVHVVARADAIVVHARVDGALDEVSSIPTAEPVMATLDELVGNGRVSLAVGERTVELRPAVLPTVQGTRFTFRVVENDAPPQSLEELLGTTGAADDVRSALGRRHGLVVLCSPAASWRPVLLHSALYELAEPGRAIVSIEDPVEHLVDGVDQVDVDPRSGVTFASGLHTILRSDPDVAAVGELSDHETARLATRGALESRLVVTTLAAARAVDAACRLRDLGNEPESLAEALACVVASRRLRAICLECRTSSYATLDELSLLGRPPEESGRRLVARSTGCAACDGTGYAGWLHVSETLPLTDDVRQALATGAPRGEIARAAATAGMRSVADAAGELCLEGMTAGSEVARLVGATG